MIKSTREDKEAKEEIDYPCLMINSHGEIMLFTKYGTGTVVRPEANDVWGLGTHCTDWEMEFFKPYNGKVTLENE